MLQRRPRPESARPKKLLPVLLVGGILWLGVGALVYFADPQAFFAVPVFLMLVFLATLLTAATLFANRRRGLLLAGTVTVFLLLRYFGIGNLLNLLLLVGVALCTEIYLSRR